MATEYRLSYTASEIDERLGRVDTLSEEIEDLKVGVDKSIITEAVNVYLEENPVQAGVTTTQSDSLWAILQKMAFTEALTDAELTAFKTAWNIESSDTEPEEPEVTLSSISATYGGGDVPVGTVVTDLTDVVVTAHYSDGSATTVTEYTLSGTIEEGSNTITVSYGGKTTTFTITGVAAEVTSLRGVQLPIVPSNFATNENWQYSGNSGNLHSVIGSARYLYLGRVFTGTVYLRNVTNTPFTVNTAKMHLVAEDYITNQTAEGEALAATEVINQFNGTYLTVSQDGSEYEFTNDYTNGALYGWVRLQRFDIPDGKYAVISAAVGGNSANNTTNVDGWFTAFFEDPIDNITVTEVYE